MRIHRLILGLCAPVALAFGQLDSNSVTVTATRSANVQADQAVFNINVTSGLNKSLADIVSAVQSVGVTMAHFVGLNSYGGSSLGPAPSLTWVFSLPVPLTNVHDIANTLVALQKSIGQNSSGLSLSFTVQNTQVSTQTLQAQTCSLTDLLSDARTKAQGLATAAGLKVGAILAMSSNIASGPNAVVAVSGILTSTVIPNCSVTVKFALGS